MRRISPSTNPFVRGVFPLLIFFLVWIFSGIFEKIPSLSGLHLVAIVGGFALIVIALGGRLPVILNNPIAKSLALFTAWFIICIPFAVWRGGSFATFEDKWSRSALAFLLVAGCITAIGQSKTIFKTIGYSVGVLAVVTVGLRGVDRTGRLGLLGTRYENANDLAWTLIFGLPFLAFLFLRGTRPQKFFALLSGAAILFALVKTGSRAGMIGLGVLALMGFLQASRTVKIRLAIGVPILLALLFAVTPPELRGRYTTLFGSGKPQLAAKYLTSGERLESTASASAEARKKVLKDSIRLTLTHPLFGVGPGNFPVAQNDLALARGEPKGAWLVTHNSYTEISSEMGIPGLVIYLVFLYRCIKPLNSIARSKYPGKDWRDLRALAEALRATFFAVMTVAFLESYAYDPNIPIMAGLACALALIAKQKRSLIAAPEQVASTLATLPEPALEPAAMSFR